MDQWFMDEEFKTPLPEELSEECARIHGKGLYGIDFAQGLAAFLNDDSGRNVLSSILKENSENVHDGQHKTDGTPCPCGPTIEKIG